MRLQLIILIILTILCNSGYETRAQESVLTLEEVKSMALENNKNLRKAQASIEAAQANNASANAANKPTVDVSLSGMYLGDPLNSMLPEYSGNGILSASQVLYAGGKINNNRKLTATETEVRFAQKALTEDEVLLKVETCYWNLISIKQQTVLANEYIRLLDALHTTLQNSYDAGMIYKNDLLKVEVQMNEAELDLTKVKDGLTLTKLEFAQVIGMEGLNFDVPDDTTFTKVNRIMADIQSSVEKRPEVAMMNKSVEIQEILEKLQQGERKPTVALSAYGIYGYGDGMNFTNGDDDLKTFAGLVSVQIPIFDWGGRKAKVREQQSKTESQRLELEETKELIRIEIQNAWLKLNQSHQKIGLTMKSLQQAEENLRLNENRFEAGTVIGEDVLEAQVLWQQAYSNLINAKAEYMINEAIYRKATGELN